MNYPVVVNSLRHLLPTTSYLLYSLVNIITCRRANVHGGQHVDTPCCLMTYLPSVPKRSRNLNPFSASTWNHTLQNSERFCKKSSLSSSMTIKTGYIIFSVSYKIQQPIWRTIPSRSHDNASSPFTTRSWKVHHRRGQRHVGTGSQSRKTYYTLVTAGQILVDLQSRFRRLHDMDVLTLQNKMQ